MLKRSIAFAVAAATLAAGSASAAEDFEVGVNGYINAGFLASDVEDNNTEYDAASIRMDNLINISGESVLDNGLKVSAVAGFSLAYDSPGGAGTSNQDLQHENLYIQVGGSFGDVRIGRSRNVGTLFHSFIPSAGVGTFGVDDARTNAFIGGYQTTATSFGESEYANRISYESPSIAGIQVGVSYTPETDPTHQPSTETFNRFGGANAWTQNELSFGAKFDRTYDNVGVNASFGYTMADAPTSSTTAVRDLEAIHGGVNLSYAGFTLGGAYGKYEDPSVASGHTEAYGLGGKYETGPWGFGASVLYKEASNATSAFAAGNQMVQEATFYEVGTTYALGSGVTAGAGVYYNDNVDSTTAGSPEDSLAGVLNLSVAF